ncbi:hypothetical protein [Paenibacillus herberti]|uniref:hypothetical protein n=1 Tax=Paenibacillus herberti TaxID=1619309 RepID=UPI0015958B58|nr:hypothetical protein [Paenibacillus herberti]
MSRHSDRIFFGHKVLEDLGELRLISEIQKEKLFYLDCQGVDYMLPVLSFTIR